MIMTTMPQDYRLCHLQRHATDTYVTYLCDMDAKNSSSSVNWSLGEHSRRYGIG